MITKSNNLLANNKQLRTFLLYFLFLLLVISAASYVNKAWRYHVLKETIMINSPKVLLNSSTNTAKVINTTNWKTYRNIDLGFTLKHPEYLKPVRSSSENTEIIDFISKPASNSVVSIRYGSLYSNYYDIARPLSNEDLISENKYFEQFEGSEYKEEDILLDATSSKKISFNLSASNYHFIKIYLKKNDTQIEISAETAINDKDQFLTIFNKILSTLKFLD